MNERYLSFIFVFPLSNSPFSFPPALMLPLLRAWFPLLESQLKMLFKEQAEIDACMSVGFSSFQHTFHVIGNDPLKITAHSAQYVRRGFCRIGQPREVT
jgi:hypothetical protein